MRLSDDPTVTMEFRRPNDPAAGIIPCATEGDTTFDRATLLILRRLD
jgi:hypothetical protein